MTPSAHGGCAHAAGRKVAAAKGKPSLTATDPYRCELCGKHHVVPSLARDCEERHLCDEPSPDALTQGASA